MRKEAGEVGGTVGVAQGSNSCLRGKWSFLLNMQIAMINDVCLCQAGDLSFDDPQQCSSYFGRSYLFLLTLKLVYWSNLLVSHGLYVIIRICYWEGWAVVVVSQVQ